MTRTSDDHPRRPPARQARDYFISHVGADRAWAEWVAAQLQAAGYSTSLAAWDFLPGTSFVTQIERAAREADRIVVLLSPDYLASVQAQPEFVAAMRIGTRGERAVLPVRVRPCEPPAGLQDLGYVDLFDRDEPAARAALLDSLTPARAAARRRSRLPAVTSGRRRFPTERPTIWQVPHARNPPFVGREQELAELERRLEADSLVILTGLPGVGKTRLIAEYVHRRSSEYGLVWWIDEAHGVGPGAQLAQLARRLNEPASQPAEPAIELSDDAPEAALADADPELIVAGLMRHEPWLLVFDHATDSLAAFEGLASLLLNPTLPARASEPTAVHEDASPPLPAPVNTTRGHLVIVSRGASPTKWPHTFPLGTWRRADAVSFLQRSTDVAAVEELSEIAAAVGDLPLALAFVSRQLAAGKTSATDCLAQLETTKRGELGEVLRVAWQTPLDQVAATAPTAYELLCLLCFLADDGTPRDLLERDGRWDAAQLEDAIAVLATSAFAQPERDGLVAHRLVRDVIRARLDQRARLAWTETAIQLVVWAFPSNSADPRTWPECNRLLPHLLAATANGERAGVETAAIGELLRRGGVYLRDRGRHAEARSLLERALAIATEAGQSPRFVAACRNDLGQLLLQIGEPEAAQTLFAEAVEHAPQTARDDPDLAVALGNLGIVSMTLGDLDRARAYLERALAIWETTSGPHSPEVGTSLNNLGRLARDTGDLAAARAYLERALEIERDSRGADDPRTAAIYSNLGATLRSLGDTTAAAEHLARALAIDEAAYGPYHAEVATDLNNLATAARDLGDLEGAVSYLERALAIEQTVFGASHPAVASTLNNLGQVRRQCGDPARAAELLERALAISEAVYGPDHPSVCARLVNLAGARQELDDAAGAEALLERALAICERPDAPRHPLTAVCLRDLGIVKSNRGDAPAARVYLERAVALMDRETDADPAHPEIAEAHAHLGRVLLTLDDPHAAEPQIRAALAAVAEPLLDIRAAAYREDLAAARLALDDPADARVELERALAIHELAAGRDQPALAGRLKRLGELCASLGDTRSASTYLARAHELAAIAGDGPGFDADRPSPDAGRPNSDADRPSPDAGRPSPDDGRPGPDADRPSPDEGRHDPRGDRS